MVSPLDGFLHFKIRKDYLTGLSPNPSIKIIPPTSVVDKFCILDVQCSTSSIDTFGVTRGKTPYGFYEDDGLYSETINVDAVTDPDLGVDKVLVDLVLLRNQEEQMTFQNPDVANAAWILSPFVTFSQKFVLRGFHLLDWVLQIDNT